LEKMVVMEQWRETIGPSPPLLLLRVSVSLVLILFHARGIGLHTCDQRRTASYIRKTYPEYTIEPGFSEEDLLWTKDTQVRSRFLLP